MRHLILRISTICLFLIFLTGSLANAQWTVPDGSGNIYNTNAGQVIVKSTTSNAGSLFYVNPMGTGRITLGESNSSILGTTSLTLNISAYQNGYSTIQSVQSSGSAWGILGLNPSGGNIGIGTTTPGNILEIATTVQNDGLKIGYNSNSGIVRLLANSLSAGAYNNLSLGGDAGLFFGTNGSAPSFGFVIAPWSTVTGGIRIDKTGNVLINKSSQANTTYVLDVNGTARANGVVVNTTGADYVFDPGYSLIPLSELDIYLRQQHHLPGIAPASQMQKEGLDLGDNQTRLLAKVEELTLYAIDQQKEIELLKDKLKSMESLQSQIDELKALLNK